MITSRSMGDAWLLSEAYVQNGLLSLTELQWMFLLSQPSVTRAIDTYQRTNQVILPCPGTVLDMGRMLTHKDLIVRLHLQGLNVLEISSRTHHQPRSIDAYLKTFDGVLILHLYGLTPALTASVLGYGEELVNEYLHIIDTYLKAPHEMRDYLQQKGLELPANVLHTG